jgi:dihydropteroate synthase
MMFAAESNKGGEKNDIVLQQDAKLQVGGAETGDYFIGNVTLAGDATIDVQSRRGFGKTLEQNFAVMRDLEQLSLLELPVLVGVSRKRMVWQLLGSSPASALNGTTALNMMALERGALILRVHDVQEAAECVRLWKAVREEC